MGFADAICAAGGDRGDELDRSAPRRSTMRVPAWEDGGLPSDVPRYTAPTETVESQSVAIDRAAGRNLMMAGIVRPASASKSAI